jgi:helix-hairpin-helix protein
MSTDNRELLQIKGIGAILARRLNEQGITTCAQLAAAGAEGLAALKGVNPRMVPSILDQAKSLAGAAGQDTAVRKAELLALVTAVRDKVQTVAALARERFAAELAGKAGTRLTRNLVKALDLLGTIEEKLPKRAKRAGKGLGKADRHLTELAAADLKGLRKGVKKARKSLERVVA